MSRAGDLDWPRFPFGLISAVAQPLRKKAMNYFLILVIICLCGGAYYEHQQDAQQIAALQQQIDDMSAKQKVASNLPRSGGANGGPVVARPAPAPVAVLPPDASRSTAIDSAAAAVTAAQDSDSLGTINTLDGRTYENCKILKIEADGITFSHADGITKVLFPLLRPELQKKYGYDPQKAVAQTEAQINYQQEVQQTPAATAPATAPATPSTP
jgi:hypothetical protein